MPSLDWEWKDVDLGSLPAWLGAFSLLLAYRIFRNDRTNAERAQVDLIGAWAEPASTWREISAYEVRTQPYIRNSSELPVEVKMLAYEIHTTWLVGDVHIETAGSPVVKQFLYDVSVPPQQTWDNAGTPAPANVAHTAPEGGLGLTPSAPSGVRSVGYLSSTTLAEGGNCGRRRVAGRRGSGGTTGRASTSHPIGSRR